MISDEWVKRQTHRWFFVCRRCITSFITKTHNSPSPGLAGHQPHAGPNTRIPELIKLPRLKTLPLLNAPISSRCICHHCCISHSLTVSDVSCPQGPDVSPSSVLELVSLTANWPEPGLSSASHLWHLQPRPGHCSPHLTYPRHNNHSCAPWHFHLHWATSIIGNTYLGGLYFFVSF